MHIFQSAPPILAWGAPSFQELIVILVIVLIVFGAKRLPELARALGQSMNEFRKAKDEFEKELHKSAPTPTPAPPTEAEQQKSPALYQPAPQTVPTASPEQTSHNSENRAP